MDLEFKEMMKSMLISEIMKKVKKNGKIEFSTAFSDGIWAVSIDEQTVTLFGYAAQNMTHELDALGFDIIKRDENDQKSIIFNPKLVLQEFTLSNLATIYENFV